jgi:hypothetical protein
VILFGVGTMQEFQALKEIMELFCAATGMQINLDKSNILVSEIQKELLDHLDVIIPYAQKRINGMINTLVLS